MPKSLSNRIISLSIIWIVIALLITSIVLVMLYQHHIEEHYDAHVFTHLEELVAAVETDSEGNPGIAGEPTDPRFNRLNSGWYWEVRKNEKLLAHSASMGQTLLDISNLVIDENHTVQTLFGPSQEELRAHVVEVNFPRGAGSLQFIATAPKLQIMHDVKNFALHIMLSFLILGAGLLVAVFFQVRTALKPLRAIGSEISQVKEGKVSRLSEDYPDDVQPLVDELNYLLDHNELLLKRARNHLGDLAHAVKNPLTVIRNEARSLVSEQGQLILDQSHAMASSIDHCLSRARIYGNKDIIGYRTSIAPIIEDLIFAVERIYHARGIDIQLAITDASCFRGDAQDIEEMVGNLIDNACKWASSKILVSCVVEANHLRLTIEDDGPGIEEKNLEIVMQRGRKLDESKPGHGQGLSIVNDIADLYGGSLRLGRSSLGGLRAELDLPAA